MLFRSDVLDAITREVNAERDGADGLTACRDYLRGCGCDRCEAYAAARDAEEADPGDLSDPAPVPGDEGVRFDQSRGFGAIDPGPTFDLVGIPGSLEGRWALNVARLGDEDDGDPGVGALPGARRE